MVWWYWWGKTCPSKSPLVPLRQAQGRPFTKGRGKKVERGWRLLRWTQDRLSPLGYSPGEKGYGFLAAPSLHSRASAQNDNGSKNPLKSLRQAQGRLFTKGNYHLTTCTF